MVALIRKELADTFTSIRFFMLIVLALAAAALAIFTAANSIRSVTSSQFVFLDLFTSQVQNLSFGDLLVFTNFVAIFLVPLIGISLGFDAINSERSNGTLSRLLSQPIYRDNVINAKFISGVITLSLTVGTIMLLIGGYGLRMIGVPPEPEEIIRLFLFGLFAVIYGAFWLGLAILFSTVFRRVASSLITSVGIWLVFGFLYSNFIIPAFNLSTNTALTLLRISPGWLFREATTTLLVPQWRGMDLLSVGNNINYMIPNPLSLGQSVIIVWPQLVTLIALTIICFAVSYVIFMRQEVRST